MLFLTTVSVIILRRFHAWHALLRRHPLGLNPGVGTLLSLQRLLCAVAGGPAVQKPAGHSNMSVWGAQWDRGQSVSAACNSLPTWDCLPEPTCFPPAAVEFKRLSHKCGNCSSWSVARVCNAAFVLVCRPAHAISLAVKTTQKTQRRISQIIISSSSRPADTTKGRSAISMQLRW